MGNRIDTSAFPDLWERVMYRKVLNLHKPTASANFITFQTSQMTINHETYEQFHTMFDPSYTQQTYSIALHCRLYVFARIFYLSIKGKITER